jgi:hypothetical protein
MVSSARVNRTKEKFAHLLGGFDEEGQEHRLARDPKDVPAAQNRHLFAVRNKDDENPAWHFVRGVDALSKIQEDYWEIVYIGKADGCSYKTSEGEIRFKNKRYVQYLIKQVEDLVEGEKRRDLRNDVIREDSYYTDLLKQKKTDIESRLEKE